MSPLATRRPHNWKGGRVVASNGYILIHVGKDHPLADVRGYAYEHRLVASRRLGRWLRPDEQVHHKDEDKANNAEGNLEVLDSAHHHFEHRVAGRCLRHPDEPNVEIACACGCGSRLLKFDYSNRSRAYLSGHNPHEASTLDAIVEALRECPLHRTEIRRRVGTTLGAIAGALTRLKRRGRVIQSGRGRWSLGGLNNG